MATTHRRRRALITLLPVDLDIVGVDFVFSGNVSIVRLNGDLFLNGLPTEVEVDIHLRTRGFTFANNGTDDSAAKALFLSADINDKAKAKPLPSVFRGASINYPKYDHLTLTSKNNDHKTYYYTLNVMGPNGPLSWDPIIVNY